MNTAVLRENGGRVHLDLSVEEFAVLERLRYSGLSQGGRLGTAIREGMDAALDALSSREQQLVEQALSVPMPGFVLNAGAIEAVFAGPEQAPEAAAEQATPRTTLDFGGLLRSQSAANAMVNGPTIPFVNELLQT